MIICVAYAQFKITASLAKGAVCAGGTRLPPTEPTGEIGSTVGGGGIPPLPKRGVTVKP